MVLACAAALACAAVAKAVDLSVASVEITQALQTASGDLPLIARNATMVRVKVSLNGQATPQPGVDALLRIYANGVEIPQSPVYSSNGPITAPPNPSSDNIDDTVNFLCVPPEGANIDFVVTVNPFGTVAESSTANNTLTLAGRQFQCRRMVEIAYVPVNYVPGGGLPDATMIEPGNGDSFLRAIYKTGDWNYHRSPLPPLVHYFDINFSNTTLLYTLLDIRQNQIPAAGYPQPEFVYGWLPGNPYFGNGQALFTPGPVAFGNTDPLRYQRTFAHELGHCWGQPHNQLTLDGVGVDVERELRDPLGIAQVMPATKRDVMVPSLNTADAWVASLTYLDAIGDARSACLAFGGGDGPPSGPADDATTVLRIAGSHDHVMRRVALTPAMTHDSVVPSADDPRGNVMIESFASDGARLHAVRIDTASCRESCAEAGHLYAVTALYANIPQFAGGREASRIVVRECRGGVAGRPLATLVRSAHAPEITAFTVRPAAAGAAPAPLDGRVRIEWSARDLDGDALFADLLYSPDGGSAWFPLSLGETTGSFEFDADDVPASRGANARFAVRVSDGMNTARRSSGSSRLGGGHAPDVHVISPNAGEVFAQGATVILHGSAWDMEDQLLRERDVVWTSSLDGTIGEGRLLARRNLSPGTHILTVRGTDAAGMWSERSVTVTVTPRVFNNCNLDGEGAVGAGDLVILLSDWGGHGEGDVDLDGVVGPRDLSILLERWSR